MSDRDGDDQAFVDAISEWPDINDGPPTLAGFLLARIAEDKEAAWRAAEFDGTHGHWQESGGNVHLTGEHANHAVAVGPFGGSVGVPAHHIARHDPARVLAECEAKRRIIASVTDPTVMCEVADDVLRALALPYADHPDYRAEWRP